MADRWRRQTLASWDVLLDFDHATIATYAYLATGPAATKTGCIRIHKRRLRRDLELKGTQVDAVLVDLAASDLIALSTKGDVLTIYLCGMLADCPPANPNTRRGYVRDLIALGDCEATSRAVMDLSATGKTDLELIEHTGNRTPTLGQPSDNVVGYKRQDKTRQDKTKQDETHLAPASPGHAPKKGRNPTPAAKVVAVTRAYLDICVPARMPKVNTDADGMPSPAIAKTVAKAIKANGAEYDWRGLFTQASRGAHLRGENDRQWRASLAWLCNPTNAAKVESGNYGDTSPPPPPGTRRSYPNFPE